MEATVFVLARIYFSYNFQLLRKTLHYRHFRYNFYRYDGNCKL